MVNLLKEEFLISRVKKIPKTGIYILEYQESFTKLASGSTLTASSISSAVSLT